MLFLIEGVRVSRAVVDDVGARGFLLQRRTEEAKVSPAGSCISTRIEELVDDLRLVGRNAFAIGALVNTVEARIKNDGLALALGDRLTVGLSMYLFGVYKGHIDVGLGAALSGLAGHIHYQTAGGLMHGCKSAVVVSLHVFEHVLPSPWGKTGPYH